MASTVFEPILRVILFTLTITISAIPTCADDIPCNSITTCRLGKEKYTVKTTVTPSPPHESQKATHSRYKVEVRNRTVLQRLYDDMETVTSELTSTAAHCNFEETVVVDLGALLDAGEGALVTLVAGEARLTAHRAVLATRSPAFAAMLCHGSQGASSGQVAIPDVEGPVLRHVLAYLYTLQAPQLPGMAPQLLAAADKFGLSALKAECELQVATQLAVETAAATAVLAMRHSSTSLRQVAIAFIRDHWVQVLATKGWADALRHQPEDVIEVSRLLAEPPEETSTPAAEDGQPTTEAQSQSHTGRGQTPATAAPPTPPRQTPSPGSDAGSRLRSLSAEEKGWRLVVAARHGTVEEVEALLLAGADVGARDGGRNTALHWAAYMGHVDAARRLLGAGAEVDAKQSSQATPLHWAAEEGHATMVRLLLAYLADIEARTVPAVRTPLHLAARRGHAAVVRVLLASSADTETRDNEGWTPLHFATYWGRTEAAAALLAAGADREPRDYKGRIPMDLARQGRIQVLIDLLI